MDSKSFLKNLTGTACALGIVFSLNTSSTVLINGVMEGNIEKNQSNYDQTSTLPKFGSIRDNFYVKQSMGKLETEARSMFGEMRDATLGEQQAIGKYISSIAKDTGVNFFDIC